MRARLARCSREKAHPHPCAKWGTDSDCAPGWGLAHLSSSWGRARCRPGQVSLLGCALASYRRASPSACLSSCSWREQASGLARRMGSAGGGGADVSSQEGHREVTSLPQETHTTPRPAPATCTLWPVYTASLASTTTTVPALLAALNNDSSERESPGEKRGGQKGQLGTYRGKRGWSVRGEERGFAAWPAGGAWSTAGVGGTRELRRLLSSSTSHTKLKRQ